MRRAPLVLLLATASGATLAADPPLPFGTADVEGARALALSAFLGVPGGNDAILLNPGALAARRRYAMELHYAQERLGPSREVQWLQGSVVDSVTSSTAGAFAYTRILEGSSTGSLYHLALAGPLGGGLFAGATGKFLDLRGPGDLRTGAATVDAGLYWQASQLVGFGVAGYNLVPIGNVQEAPRGLGAGLSVGDDQRIRGALDWRTDWDRRGRRTDAWLAGVELLLADAFPVRGGFVRDGTRGRNSWSAGIGVVSTGGVAIDLAYRQSLQAPAERIFGAALKLQMLQ